MQQDRGLYAPLIVEDPKEPLSYDKEWVVVLDDWVDGVDGSTPDAVLAELHEGVDTRAHGPADDMDHGDATGGMDIGPQARPVPSRRRPVPDADGRPQQAARRRRRAMSTTRTTWSTAAPPDDPQTFRAKPGDRIRIRFINAGGDTAYRVALGGHRMTVTHTDGFPVEHAETDALLLGHGRALRRPGHRQGRRLPAHRARRGQEALRAGRAAHRRAARRPARPPGPRSWTAGC